MGTKHEHTNKGDDLSKRLKTLALMAPEELQQKYARVELASPPQLQAEERLCRALSQLERKQPEPPGLWQRFIRLFAEKPQTRWPVLACACALVLLPFTDTFRSLVGIYTHMSPPPTHQPLKQTHLLFHPKGNSTTETKARILLHIGDWEAKTKSLRRLAPNERCFTDQSLVFAFSPISPGGFMTLYRIPEYGAPQLFFPFDAKHPQHMKPSHRIQFLRLNGVVQQYQLRHERGEVLFVLLQTPQPLSQLEHQSILKLTHKQLKTGQVQLLPKRKLTNNQIASFVLHVEKRK